MISPSTFEFLQDLAAHNDRDWFQTNKKRYEDAHHNAIDFAEALFERMSQEDHLVHKTGKQMLFRIYRDVRFSKDKSPYKKHFSGSLKRATEQLRGGYYFHLEPGDKSVIAGGFFGPNPADLKRIRTALEEDAQPLREICTAPTFVELFGELYGEGVKTAPKGFDKNHPDIDLIRKKQFLVKRSFTDAEVLSEGFLEEAVRTFVGMHPFFDYMSEILTS